MASACLPNLFPAVRIGRFYYWDGAFSANPDLLTLISETGRSTIRCSFRSVRIVIPDLPASEEDISGNIGRLTFNHPLQVAGCSISKPAGACPAYPVPRPMMTTNRMGRHRFHLIDGSPHILKLVARDQSSGRTGRWSKACAINGRQDRNRTGARQISSRVGKPGVTVNLYAKYFSDRVPFD